MVETNTQIETILENGIQEPISLPLWSNATIGSWNLQYCPLNPFGIIGETIIKMKKNLGNEIQDPFSFPYLIPSIIVEIGGNIGDLQRTTILDFFYAEPNGKINNQARTNIVPSLQAQFVFRC
ncbi:hypothetical protein GQ457_03G016310 [Hibiscus cannabinus]